MKFVDPLAAAVLVRRYKRFLADVQLPSSEVITVHCPNTGSMLGCQAPGSRVWISKSDNAKRKYAYSWELVETAPGILVGIHTGRANELIREAIQSGVIESLQGYASLGSEVRYGQENSRVDFCLEQGERPDVFVEVKSVTAIASTADDGKIVAIFPDAVSERASKHVRELMQVVQEGKRAVLCFCVQREDALAVRPAWEIDPHYAALLDQAQKLGVEVIAYKAKVTTEAIQIETPIPVLVR